MSNYRVGFGFDVHRFTKKKKDLVLGGVKIPFSFGLEAVSDGDVVLHSICDAICGGCLLGDIGDYFPPTSKKSKGIKSTEIVKVILSKIGKKFEIINIDITIIVDKPPLVFYKKKILKSLKEIFSITEVNIKIKSKEGLNILGGKNSIACITIALLEKC